jgi:hypothetical protein
MIHRTANIGRLCSSVTASEVLLSKRYVQHCLHNDAEANCSQAYNMARANEDDSPGIGASTTGMVFMGTPHHGTGQITSQGLMYKAIAEQLDVEDSVLRALSSGDEALGDALSEFMRLVNVPTARVQICCFFEQKQTMVGKEFDDNSLKARVK